MKTLFSSIAVVVVLEGCGGLGSKSGDPLEKSEGEKQLPPANAVEESVSKTPGDEPKRLDVTGMWQNSSCGERKYKRQINFANQGRFNAIDEIAPCPPEKKCVWSGIVEWTGTWALQDRSIRLDIEPFRTGKLPESPPDEFLVLGEDPVSIGEKSGDIICPYQMEK